LKGAPTTDRRTETDKRLHACHCRVALSPLGCLRHIAIHSHSRNRNRPFRCCVQRTRSRFERTPAASTRRHKLGHLRNRKEAREREKKKAVARTCRVVLLAASNTMGARVYRARKDNGEKKEPTLSNHSEHMRTRLLDPITRKAPQKNPQERSRFQRQVDNEDRAGRDVVVRYALCIENCRPVAAEVALVAGGAGPVDLAGADSIRRLLGRPTLAGLSAWMVGAPSSPVGFPPQHVSRQGSDRSKRVGQLEARVDGEGQQGLGMLGVVGREVWRGGECSFEGWDGPLPASQPATCMLRRRRPACVRASWISKYIVTVRA